ncbi:hypothetical protein [Pseudomonas putida]
MTSALPDQLLPPLLFGAFADEIDPLWRHLQVVRQQDAIRQATGDDPDLTSSAWLTLKTHQRDLGDARRACAAAARAVVGRTDAWPQFKPGQVLFDALCTAHIRALRAEYHMAKSLGQLTDVQAARLLSVLEAPDDAQRPDGDTLVADLALLNPEGNEVVPGVMLITHRDALQNPTAAYDVLVYWPGAEGGLAVFNSLDHVKRELLMWLDEAVQAQTTLSLAPIVGHAFEVGLARQWRRLHAHALAIDAGERLYDDAPSPEASRQRWQQEAVASLSAARHDARDQAFADLLQEHTASDLARGLPAWMTHLAQADRDLVDQRLNAYLQALGKARQQLQRDVAPRDEFVATRLAGPLQRDFGLQPEQVLIDLPVSVEAVKELVSEGGTPGTPSRQVNTPSRERETLTLSALALAGVDKALSTRLHFAHVQGVGLADTARLPTVDQLKALCAELDVPAVYEQTLRDAFMGPRAESAEAVTARRQVLLAPWHASLALHTTLAHLRGQLDAEAIELLGNAGALLHTVGLHRGPNALDGSRTTLGSVTLIRHPEKPLTVLHLPDAPNGKVLTAHASPDAACTALAGMALESGMVDYLATQPVVGNPAQQAGYLRQALLNNFTGFVFPGEPVATAASLAERQLNVQMGRIITQHRASARSQDTLWLEAAAQGHAVIFPIIKVFIGLVPFVGTAVGLYDAFENAMAVVDAWANGRPGEGLDQMENLLAALVGAAMDVLPGLAAGNALKVRSVVRARQTANARRLTPGTTDGLYGSAFRGYESELSPLLLRNAEGGVFSHADQRYIVRAGTAYAVQWDATYRTWRLRGNALKTYRQPVVRDADGNWNTHGAVHGRLVSGGLEGGGGVLTHVADQMVERLPLAVQRRLPRWLGDAQAREQRRIYDRLITEEREVSRLFMATEWARQRYVNNDEALRNALLKVALEEVQACDQLLLTLGQQRARLPDHIYRNTVRGTRYQAMGRIQNLIRLGKDRLRTLSANYARIQDAQGDVIAAAERGDVDIDRFVRASEDFLRQARELRIQLLEQADFIDHWSARFEKEWHSAALDPKRRTDMERVMRESDYRYQPRLHQVIKAETLLKLVLKDEVGGTAERVELARLFARDVRALNALLTTWRDMGEVVNLSGAHRKRLLEQFASEMEYFRWRLEEWTGAYPEQIDLRYQKGVLRHLKALRDHALADLARDNPTLRREQPEGGPRKRVFETVDDRVLIGVEQGRGDAQIMQVDLQDGSAQRYQRQANGKWRLQEAAALQQQLSELQAQARVRLDKSAQLVLRAEGYGRRGMSLASVDDLLANEGRSLQELARQIERLATAADDIAELVAQLRDRGQDLIAQATVVRVRLSKTSQQPTMAYVEYLLEQRQVRLERRGGRVPEGFEGQSFLQEYAVVELATGEDLWFAHFHYQKQRHAFDAFSAAHLKRADQRLLGAQWEAQQAAQGANERVWRSPISLAQARRHFEPLV